MHNKLSPVK